MKTILVLPTYNERENMAILIPKLEQAFKKIKKHSMHILVVDDNSPDKTADEVKKLQKKYKNLHLLMGQKQGLGVAYLRGFKHAVEKLKADILLMMDSDLSHPPEMIPDFMKEIDNGYDLVVGSRYIKGGSTPDWGMKRKLISRGGNFFARVVAGLYKVHDCTSGYRAIRVPVFKKINTRHLHTRGYAFMSTLLYELISVGAKVKELPLIFYDRKYGKTKLQRKDMIEFFLNVFRLRFKSTKRMIKF
ncbi:MAG: polyprenol monophosphomannose synthase, partial [Nanoarchaeota archaeon]|nr:polyprenol monophosphomannose synthase [Nanoarchaeota archaeon]